MAEKKPSEERPTQGQIKKEFKSDFERVLGVDDETLKRKKQPPRKGCRSAMLVAIIVTMVLAFGAYLFTGDRALSGAFDEILGRRVGVEHNRLLPRGGTREPATKDEAKTKRWLIIRSDNARPQFTIELQGDGPTGRAVWLEPPPGVGTYEWSGDRLSVKLVLKDHKAAPDVTFDQHFEIDMTRGADDKLTGTMSAENWRYSPDTGLELLGMVPYEATGEPK